jgi:hypothetical protein
MDAKSTNGMAYGNNNESFLQLNDCVEANSVGGSSFLMARFGRGES